jgi:4-hydroxy-3-polyprenylbenzoate decarboxylase
MNNKKKIIVAVTGASGSVFAQILLERISTIDEITECALIFSDKGREVWKFETENDPQFGNIKKIRLVENSDMFDAVASGSSNIDAMIIIPCSMGTLGRIASGISSELILRAADVMLKEKKPLILVPREAPYNSVHLENMLKLDRAGAFIMPASPFYYHKPSTIFELISPFVERILEKSGISAQPFRWNG